MTDYSVNIKAKLQGFEKLDEWDSKIKAMSQGVDIPLNLGGSGKNSVKTQAANIGRTINTGVSNALKGSNINPTIQKYATEIKKQFDNDKQLSSVLQSAFDLDESEANKMVSKLRSKADKIDSEAQKAFNKQQANAKKSLNEQAKSIEKINKLKSDALKYDAVGKTSEANNARRKITQEQALIKERNKSIQKARNNGLISDGDIKSILSSAGRKGYLNYKNTKDLVADKEAYKKISSAFSNLQKNAENKNAKHDAWVNFGKSNIEKWRPMQQQTRKNNELLLKQQQSDSKNILNEQAKSIEKINKLRADALKYNAIGDNVNFNDTKRKLAQEQSLAKERNKIIQEAKKNGYLSGDDIKNTLFDSGKRSYINYKNTKDLVADKEKYQKIANTFSDLQKKAENKNAKHNAWVEFGKSNIAKWKPIQQQVKKDNDNIFKQQQVNAKKLLDEQANGIQKINKLKSDALKYDVSGNKVNANDARRRIAQEQELLKERNKSIQLAKKNGLLSDLEIKDSLSTSGRNGYLNYKNTKDLVADKQAYQKKANTFSDLQSKAEAKNAKHDAWVEFGKSNIAKWKPIQEQVRKENDTLFKQQQANAEKLVNDQIAGYKKVQDYRQKQLRAEDQGQTDRAAYYARQREQEIGYLKDRNKELQKAVKSGYIDGNDVKTRTSSVGRQVANNINDTKSGIEQKRLSSLQEQANKIKSDYRTNVLQNRMSNAVDSLSIFSKTEKGYSDLEDSVYSAASFKQKLNTALADLSSNPSVDNQRKVVDLYNDFDNSLKSASNSAKILTRQNEKMVNGKNISALENKMRSFGENNTRMGKYNQSKLNGMINSLGSVQTVGQEKEIRAQFEDFKNNISQQGLTGKSLFGEIGRGFKQIGQFATTYGVIQKVTDGFVNSLGELKEVDSIITEISKTSDLTSSELKQLGNDSFEHASRYGMNASDYLYGVQEMSRSGFYGDKATELADLSVLTQAAGDVSSDIANSYLLATNAAYNYRGSVEKLNAVLDGQNMINKVVMPCRKLMAS